MQTRPEVNKNGVNMKCSKCHLKLNLQNLLGVKTRALALKNTSIFLQKGRVGGLTSKHQRRYLVGGSGGNFEIFKLGNATFSILHEILKMIVNQQLNNSGNK